MGLELNGCLVYGLAISRKVPKSFLICCSINSFGEGLCRAMLVVWNEILVGLQQLRAIASRWQVLDLFPKDPTYFDRPSSTDKAEDLAKDGVYG